MRQLRLVGLNEDGTRLVLRDEGAKADFLLPLDERLSAALRGDRARLGQLEITLESQLRPREMQARVRAGASAEQVAKTAGLPLDRVLRFVAPVIDERNHIVRVARHAAVRRAGADGPGPVLEPTVSARLEAKGIDSDTLDWDAWRRDDGRWTVQVSYALDGRARIAQWSYDAGAKSAVALDDEARALTGTRPSVAPAALFEDAVSDAMSGSDSGSALGSDEEQQRAWDAQPPRLATVPQNESQQHGSPQQAAQQDEIAVPAVAEAGSRRGAKRAQVPSWDEIMFGRRRTRD